jgi:hypothetical protein
LPIILDHNNKFAAEVPNNVTSEEYEVYSASLRKYLKEHASVRAEVEKQTMPFAPLAGQGCGDEWHRNNNISWAMMRKLQAVGQRRFQIQLDRLPAVSDLDQRASIPELAHGQKHYLSFSRVVFDNSKTEAFFAVSDSCGALCGKGGPVKGTRQGREWVFESFLDCSWLY